MSGQAIHATAFLEAGLEHMQDRAQQGQFKADNYEDGAAYFGLMGEAASKGRA